MLKGLTAIKFGDKTTTIEAARGAITGRRSFYYECENLQLYQARHRNLQS